MSRMVRLSVLLLFLVAATSASASLGVEPPAPDTPETPEAPDSDEYVPEQASDAADDAERDVEQRINDAQQEADRAQGELEQVERARQVIVERATRLVDDAIEDATQAVGTVERQALFAKRQVDELAGTVTVPLEEEPDHTFTPATQASSESLVEEIPLPVWIAAGTLAAAGAAAFFWITGSSAVGGGTAAVGKDLKRILPIASPLFTRFEKETVMGHPKREQLYALIVEHPGVPLQQLCDTTGLSRTAVTHHLRLLEHHHLIVSKRVGRSRHFFENGGRYGRDQKAGFAVLQNERSKEVASFIRAHPGAIQKNVCQKLGLQASIAHWHVRRLQEASLIESVREGRTVSYYPTAALQSMEA